MLHKFLIRSYCEELGDIPLPYFCFPPCCVQPVPHLSNAMKSKLIAAVVVFYYFKIGKGCRNS